MSDLTLTPIRLHRGIWEGSLVRTGDSTTPPDIAVTHREQPLDGVTVTPDTARPGQWSLRVPVPPAALSDGVQTFLIHDRAVDVQLGAFAIALGDVLDGDIRAEIELLRAELDMLKRAFRRHCVETA